MAIKKSPKTRQNVLLVTKPTIIDSQHNRIVKQLRELGYGVAEGRANDDALIDDVFMECLPPIEE